MENQDRPPLKLRCTAGDALPASWDVFPGVTLGRSPGADIVLDDPLVSKRHCEIVVNNDVWTLRDLGSSNGTYLNGTLVRNAELKEGDSIRLGTTELRLERVVDENPPEPEPLLTQVIDLSAEGGSFIPERLLTEDALRRDYEKLRAGHEMNRQMAIDLPLDELLARILDVLFEMIQADGGAVLLADEAGELTPRCIRTREGVDCPGGDHPFSRTILREAFHGQKGIIASDATVDERFSGAESVLVQGIRSVLCVPMIGNERVYGVIHLDTRGRAGAFTEKDLQILSAAARQAALALENGRLLARVEETTRTKEQLKRFLPPAIVTEMMGDRIRLDRAPREVVATVLFSDIRGFTALSEQTSTPRLIQLLNDYFDRMVEVVFDHGGVLDKFVGDALMAVWGVIEEEADAGAGRATATALDMIASLAEFNRAAGPERPQLRIGIGVNTGPVVAGFMGSHSRRLEFTVVGDTVNIASRLCSLAKAGEVLIGGGTFERIGSPGTARPLEGIPLKGKSESVPIYALDPSIPSLPPPLPQS